LHFDNAVNHLAHEPCPVLNLEVWKTYFKKNPVIRSDRTSTTSASGRQQSNTSNPRGTKPSSNSSTLHNLPANFDETTTCSHCYRSGQGSGRDSVSRRQDHTKHPSAECPYLKLKQANRQGAPRYPSPGMQQQQQQQRQSGGYSNNNPSYNPNYQGNLGYYDQDTGQNNNNQYSQGQQQQFLGNNTFDQHGQNNHRDHNTERGRDHDRDRRRDRERTRENSQSTHNSNHNSESGRETSRSRSRDRN